MKRIFDRFDAVMAAVAFAEASEVETARCILADARKRRQPPRP